jgi:hypothetical protein
MSHYIVQSVQLRRPKFTREQAFAWIRSHGYKAEKIDVTPGFFRFRQVDPARLHGGRFRTIELGDTGLLTVVYM